MVKSIPHVFIFQLSNQEVTDLKSQIVTLSWADQIDTGQNRKKLSGYRDEHQWQ